MTYLWTATTMNQLLDAAGCSKECPRFGDACDGAEIDPAMEHFAEHLNQMRLAIQKQTVDGCEPEEKKRRGGIDE